MAVAENGSWKVPIGYFLIDGMSGGERANLINESLHRLHAAGVEVVLLTCDGLSCHFAMLKALGAVLTVDGMMPYVQHPADLNTRVYVSLDACHMLKLIRNTFADQILFRDGEGQTI